MPTERTALRCENANFDRPLHHIRLKINGNTRKANLFHYMVGTLDVDYPWGPPEFRALSAGDAIAPNFEPCPKCHGLEWRMPLLGASELLRLSWQIAEWRGLPGHLKVKVKHFGPASDCTGAAETPAASGSPSPSVAAVVLASAAVACGPVRPPVQGPGPLPTIR